MSEQDTFQLNGKATRVELEGGFWGIIDQEGNQWQPVNMPEQLKREGSEVECTVYKTDAVSSAMWGEPVHIVSFETP